METKAEARESQWLKLRQCYHIKVSFCSQQTCTARGVNIPSWLRELWHARACCSELHSTWEQRAISRAEKKGEQCVSGEMLGGLASWFLSVDAGVGRKGESVGDGKSTAGTGHLSCQSLKILGCDINRGAALRWDWFGSGAEMHDRARD